MGEVVTFVIADEATDGKLSDVTDWFKEKVTDVASFYWNDFLVPQIELVAGVFGIEDENILHVQKSSSLLHENNTVDLIQAANTKAAISMMKVGGSFFNWYMAHTGLTRAQVTAYYRFAKNGRYVHGLPSMDIRGGNGDFNAIDAVLNTDIGEACTALSIQTRTPPDDVYLKHEIQSAPYNYIPWARTLTFTDPYGVSWNDYVLGTITYDSSYAQWKLSVSRVAEETLFWIDGPVSIEEGNPATYTIRCNRAVPAGESITVTLGYSGTRLSRRYVHVPYATITAGNAEVDIVVQPDIKLVPEGSDTIIVTIESIENTNAAFEAVVIHTTDSVTTTITDNGSADIPGTPSTPPATADVQLFDTITKSAYVPEHSIIITYHKDIDPASEWFYWIYKLSDTTYPSIDPSLRRTNLTSMLPVAILKKDFVAVNNDKTSAEYLSVWSMLRTIDLDINNLINQVETDPNYNLISDLYINFSMSPNSTEELVTKALWTTFYLLIEVDEISTPEGNYSAIFIEQDINNAVLWSDHTYWADKVGTIPGGGTYSHSIEVIEEVRDPEGVEILVTAEDVLHIYYQTAPNAYDEIEVRNLGSMSAIDKNGEWKQTFSKIGDTHFTIPMSYDVLNSLTMQEQLVIYPHILRMDSYAAEVVHLEFYETSGFADLFEIVSIAITLYTLGQATPTLEVIKQLLIHYAISELVLQIAERTGNEAFAALVGLVAMIALSDGTKFAFDFSEAESLLRASTDFADNLTNIYDEQSENLQRDLRDLNEKAGQRLKEIKESEVKSGPISVEFLVALNGFDTTTFPAIKAQYDYDLLFNYDRLISDYYDINFKVGVT